MFFRSKWVYLDALSFSSLFKIFAFFSSCVKAVNFAGTTSPTSFFLFPVTIAVRILSAFACKKKVNKRNSSIGTWPARVFSAFGRSCVTYTPIAPVSYSLASALLSSSQCNNCKLNCTTKLFCLCDMSLLNKRRPRISAAPETRKLLE